MANANNPTGLEIKSNGYALWKSKEAREGRDISIDTICKETGLAKMTVRKFLVPKESVSGSSLLAAASIAEYFGVDLAGLVAVEKANVSTKELVTA